MKADALSFVTTDRNLTLKEYSLTGFVFDFSTDVGTGHISLDATVSNLVVGEKHSTGSPQGLSQIQYFTLP